VIVDAVEHIREIGERVNAVHLAVSMIVMARANVSAPVSTNLWIALTSSKRPTDFGLLVFLLVSIE
jgi:hypothetical protein